MTFLRFEHKLVTKINTGSSILFVRQPVSMRAHWKLHFDSKKSMNDTTVGLFVLFMPQCIQLSYVQYSKACTAVQLRLMRHFPSEIATDPYYYLHVFATIGLYHTSPKHLAAKNLYSVNTICPYIRTWCSIHAVLSPLQPDCRGKWKRVKTVWQVHCIQRRPTYSFRHGIDQLAKSIIQDCSPCCIHHIQHLHHVKIGCDCAGT